MTAETKKACALAVEDAVRKAADFILSAALALLQEELEAAGASNAALTATDGRLYDCLGDVPEPAPALPRCRKPGCSNKPALSDGVWFDCLGTVPGAEAALTSTRPERATE